MGRKETTPLEPVIALNDRGNLKNCKVDSIEDREAALFLAGTESDQELRCRQKIGNL